MYVESSAFQIHFLSEQEHWRKSLLPTCKQQVPTPSPCFPFSLSQMVWSLLLLRGFSSRGWGVFASHTCLPLSRPCHVISFIPFNSFPGMWGKDHNLGAGGKQNWIAVKNLPLTNLLTFSKSLNFPQPCFLHLLIGDSPDVCVVWISYVSQSRDTILLERLGALWFSIFTNFIAHVDIFPSREVDTQPLKCPSSDWLSRREE